MLRKAKVASDVRGYIINCPNFIKCPLCYGCRNYNSTSPECLLCFEEGKKKNICNVELHKTDLITKMITKNHIIMNDITFNNFQGV